MSRKINIRIYKDGKVETNTLGIKGKSCTDYIKILEDLLEAKTIDSEFTPEYYEKEKNKIYEENKVSLEERI